MENALSNARLLSKSLEATGWYRCVSDIHRPKGQHEYKKGEIAPTKDGETSADYNAGLPVVAFCLTDEFKAKYPHVKQASVSNLLRAKQYIIPSESTSQPVNTERAARLTIERLPSPSKRREDRDPPRGRPRINVTGPAGPPHHRHHRRDGEHHEHRPGRPASLATLRQQHREAAQQPRSPGTPASQGEEADARRRAQSRLLRRKKKGYDKGVGASFLGTAPVVRYGHRAALCKSLQETLGFETGQNEGNCCYPGYRKNALGVSPVHVKRVDC